MKVKVIRRGNSLGFVIPDEIVKEQGIKAGDELEMIIKKKEG